MTLQLLKLPLLLLLFSSFLPSPSPGEEDAPAPAPDAPADTLFISLTQTVHLRFGSELRYVDLGSRVVVARIVEGGKDFLAVKAREKFDFCTTISCLEQSGRMHTFLVAYAENPPELDIDTRYPRSAEAGEETPIAAPPEGGDGTAPPPWGNDVPGSPSPEELSSMPRELYHIAAGGYGISILCGNILVSDDRLSFVFTVRNDSPLSYTLSDPNFSIESGRTSRRTILYERTVMPRDTYGIGTTPPSGGKTTVVVTLDKMTLPRSQVLRAYFYEKGGVRNFVLTFSPSDVNRARML